MSRALPKVGSVVIVGGGVGGMQAALDLAEAGIKVHLVEREPAIGGVMSQLDKTFPTNDCSMCIVSPRLVDVGRHLNIDVLCNSSIAKLEGEAGDFKVTVKQRSRFIDLDKCTACGECTERCPVSKTSEFDVGLARRKAIYKRYPQAVPSGYSIDKSGVAPCRKACPAGVNAQAFVRLIADGKHAEAVAIQKQSNPFPGICGRVCTHHCEDACRRGDLDEPIAIRQLKRFLDDYGRQHECESSVEAVELQSERIAIIGSGPAGLSTMRALLLRGYGVTIFEALPKLGGMLVAGLPEYRLPEDIVEREINDIFDIAKKLGLRVEVRTSTEVGKDISFAEIRTEHDAVFLATGAWCRSRLRLDGEEGISGIWDGLQLLTEVNLEGRRAIGKRVVVIGGGNTAIDVARAAVRLDAQSVTIIYRRTRDEMPAALEEVDDALEEGVVIEYLTSPARLHEDGGELVAVECVRTELGEPDDSGRRRPVVIEGSGFRIEADVLVAAIGQYPDTSFTGEGSRRLETLRSGAVVADPLTLETSMAGVFVGGDAVLGPASVIEAVATGNRAAESIVRYLRGEDLAAGREESDLPIAIKSVDGVKRRERARVPVIAHEKRLSTFDEVAGGWDEATAVAEAQRCLSCSGCCECMLCVEACEAKAIDHEVDQESELVLDAGAVILAPGYELFDPDTKKELGYDFDNVLSSLEFERMLAASGPTLGQITRPLEGARPKNIAFIQCVGSRTKEKGYCSSVCCMYATKQSVIAKEHQPDLECSVFFIDLRAFGKGFDEYYQRAQELGVRYVRFRPSFFCEDKSNGDVIIRYLDARGKMQEEVFSMVVLSCGISPPREAHALADALGIELNEHGFCKTNGPSLVDTAREGVFACGPFVEPRDIPETVTQASAAAARAMELLASEKWTRTATKEYPPERDVTGEEPRVGVFVCHCGKNIGGVIDSKDAAEFATELPDVVFATDKLYTCSQDSISSIRDAIVEHRLNRVVVAACTPRTHEQLFQDSLREARLNPYLFEFANIRDQNTWVHKEAPELAHEKALDLITMAVAKVRLHEPLQNGELRLDKTALIVGGGISGMTAALQLAAQGYESHIVERTAELGGKVRGLRYIAGDVAPKKLLAETMTSIDSEPLIHVHTNAEISSVSGSFGRFETVLRGVGNGGAENVVRHGVALIATGAQESKPTEFRYGEEGVLTLLELEDRLAEGSFQADTVVMIQCVGSRNDERPYCSRVCCTGAIRAALEIKERAPDTNVYVLYRDVRTYGFRERYYTEARDRGVIFVRYDEHERPAVSRSEEGLAVVVRDQVLGEDLKINPEVIVLSSAIIPSAGAAELAKLFKVPVDKNGFFMEAHAKLRPLDFASDGVFLAGTAHAPKAVDESVAQALGAAGRVSSFLSKDAVTLPATIAEVIDENCDGCAYCIDPCPAKALTLLEYVWKGSVKKTVSQDASICKGCGVCQATCPKQGIKVNHFRLDQLGAMVDALLAV